MKFQQLSPLKVLPPLSTSTRSQANQDYPLDGHLWRCGYGWGANQFIRWLQGSWTQPRLFSGFQSALQLRGHSTPRQRQLGHLAAWWVMKSAWKQGVEHEKWRFTAWKIGFTWLKHQTSKVNKKPMKKQIRKEAICNGKTSPTCFCPDKKSLQQLPTGFHLM
jgi:hypothetical protein